MKLQFTDWLLLSPELFLTAAGLILLLLSVVVSKAKEEFLAFLSVIFLGITGALLAFLTL